MLNLPNSVKIGAYTYDILYEDGSFVTNNVAVDGLHHFDTHTIRIANVGSPAYRETVFLHEVLHAIISCYMPNDPKNQDEDFVDQVSKGLYQLFVDNPDIFGIRKDVKDES